MIHDDHLIVERPGIDVQTWRCLQMWAEAFRTGLKDKTWVNYPGTFVGSFEWCCALFDLDPNIVRGKL